MRMTALIELHTHFMVIMTFHLLAANSEPGTACKGLA